jgi:hypothetical protein
MTGKMEADRLGASVIPAIQRLFLDLELIPVVTTEIGWPLPLVVAGLSTLHFEPGRRLFGPQRGD